MRSLLRRLCAPVWFGVLLLPLGCGPAVREDRSINWSGDGQSVGFQHGGEGVFLADKDGGKLTKIYQPGPDVLATGTPLWEPAGKRVIFTTARATAKGQPAVFLPLPGRQPDPAGNVYFQQEVIYTCWLYEEKPGDPPPPPTKLFEASCDHVGYVAANLAVRWHPKGGRILYLDRGAGKKHGLFAFDLAAKTSSRAFPHSADALIFDWTPGDNLTCVLADQQSQKTDGIWVGQPGRDDWWHVPQSDELARGEFPSPLEQLRATRPAWTADGTRFAFPTWTPGQSAKDTGHHFLRMGTLAGHTVTTLAEGAEPFRDLHWSTDGDRLGVVRGGENATLHVVRQGNALSDPVNRRPVRQFVGWNATGNRLAYVVPDDKPAAGGAEWAFLLLPEEHARDLVYVADGAGGEPGREVFSGMRVTFPQWSPKEDKLSLWFTFAPTHRSVIGWLLGGSLRRGDPAALFDPVTGKISWLAVSPHEKVQVGHYYLMKRDYATAWKWYEDAEKEWPAAKPADPAQVQDAFRALTEPRDFRFFQYYCLTKLGRDKDAGAKLDEFRGSFPPRPAPAGAANATANDALLRPLLTPDGLVAPLLRDSYCAEVFLSLDAADDGEAYFREEMKAAPNDAARLSSALVLGQLLLVNHKPREYADLATETTGPLLLKFVKPRPAGAAADPNDLQPVIELIGLYALLPLCTSEFLGGLPENEVRALIPRWQTLREKADGDNARLEIDLVLHAAYRRLGKDVERQEVARRLKDNPAPNAWARSEEDITKFIAATREMLKMFKAMQR